jgi:gluconate kinase
MVWSKVNNPLTDSSRKEWAHEFDTIYYASFNKRNPLIAVCGSVGSRFGVEIIEIQQNGSLRLFHKMDSAHDVQ